MKRHEPGLTVVIPAAGPGRRLRSHGPRSLIELEGRQTVVGRQVETIRRAHPGAEIVVGVGHEADRVIRRLPSGVKVVENEHHEDSGPARTLAMALRVASHPRVLVVQGDLVFNLAAVADVCRGWSSVVVDAGDQIDESEVGVAFQDGVATRFDFGLPERWAQIAYLSGRELELLRRACSDPARRGAFLWEVLNDVVDAGGRLRPVRPAGMRVVEIDAGRDIARAREVVRCES